MSYSSGVSEKSISLVKSIIFGMYLRKKGLKISLSYFTVAFGKLILRVNTFVAVSELSLLLGVVAEIVP